MQKRTRNMIWWAFGIGGLIIGATIFLWPKGKAQQLLQKYSKELEAKGVAPAEAKRIAMKRVLRDTLKPAPAPEQIKAEATPLAPAIQITAAPVITETATRTAQWYEIYNKAKAQGMTDAQATSAANRIALLRTRAYA